MLGLKEVVQRKVEKKNEIDREIARKQEIVQMFDDFINDNLEEIQQYFPVNKLSKNTFRVTQRENFLCSSMDNYSIELNWQNKIIVKCQGFNFNKAEIPFSLNDNKSVLYRKFKNAVRALVACGYKVK